MRMLGPIAILPFVVATAISVAMEAEEPGSQPRLKGPSAELQAAVADGQAAVEGLRLTGDVDRDFAQLMLRHQEQTLAMNKVLLEYGEDAELQALAKKLEREQKKHLPVLRQEQEAGGVPVKIARAARKP